MKYTTDQILHEIIQIVENGHETITPIALGKIISKKFNIKIFEAGRFVKRLITSSHLRFSDLHGRTVIEKSFEKPVRISDHVILKPSMMDFKAGDDDLVVNITPGASFGNGQHPSSRLAVRAIEYLLRKTDLISVGGDTAFLDIGTGTGILAITALGFGITRGVGIDIDPCARREAMENAVQNYVEDRFQVRDQDLSEIQSRFDLILANLRSPTLSRIFKQMGTLLKQPGAMILSGIKADEADHLLRNDAARRFDCVWKAAEKNWCSLVLYKTCGE
jgi:ribosomal protein L11 methyltransferase